MLDFIDEPLDQVALRIELSVIADRLRSSAARGNNRLSLGLCNSSTKEIRVVALVGEQAIKSKAADQLLCVADIMRLARAQNEAHRVPECVHADVDLGAQAAARTADRRIFAAPFFAPAAC